MGNIKEIRNKAGETVDLSNSEAFARLALEMVPNPVARSVLFGTNLYKDNVDELVSSIVRDKLGGESGLVQVMRSTINLAFVVAITRWKQLYDHAPWDHDETIEAFQNSRFTKIFLSALSKEDITLDLQVFALIELWVGLKSDEYIREDFANIYSMGSKGENFGLTLQEIRDAIKKASFGNLYATNYDLEYANYLCYKLLNSFPFLRTLEVQYPQDPLDRNKHSFYLRYPLNIMGEYVTLYPNDFYEKDDFVVTEQQLIIRSAANEEEGKSKLRGRATTLNLFMLSEASAFTGKLQYTYRSFAGDKEARIEVDEHKSESFLVEKADDIHEMRKFLSFNYKNIREFAIIVSDALKDSPIKKKEIYDLCRQRNSKIIPTDIHSADSPNIYWDNVITLMLVEIGPSDFLEHILDEKTVFDTIIQNIEWRYAGYNFIATLRSKYDASFSYLQKRCENNERAFLTQVLNLRVRTVLGAMGFDKEESRGIHAFEESLTFKFENINTCIETLRQYCDKSGGVDVVKCDAARKTLSDIYKNIFIFLQIFYTGLNAYAIKKKEIDKENLKKATLAEKMRKKSQEDRKVSADELEKNAADKFEQRRKERKDLLDEFTQAAANKYADIHKQSLIEAFKAFCTMCNQYNTYDSSKEFSISEQADNLKYLITRNYICDEKKLRFFAEIDFEDGSTKEDGSKYTVFDMLENFSYKYYNDVSYGKWLNYFQDVFLFLIYNEDYHKHGLYLENNVLEDKDCDPIYPYLVTYYKENTDRDNLKKCTYRVPIPTKRDTDPKEQGYVVTLLTEQEFPASTYFCVPLRYGSSENWWINPFLIPRGFVHKMEEFLKKKNIELK
ncbi:MAG: hypothetical protein J1G02_05880 [Clostridiales bacterium]|nr:hypothetical protein [Clostridiales bacterium]